MRRQKILQSESRLSAH